MIHLLNGSKEIRQRNSDGVSVLPCGCAHTDVMWLQMCDPHFKETDTQHRAALNEHRNGDLV